ncbi:MAG TPA: hypothetical protein PLS81_03725 [Deltaproteobacteria bacterium]|nr:hypothetical protein [Deltaproteobacteria bacterium]HOM28551.1 hypothetical protein [Deltaproteobacteria bacterium]
MRDLSSAASASPILERILPLLPQDAYVVGGCVRDLVLGVAPTDIDLVTFGDVEALATRIAQAFYAHPFVMDPERRVIRVALRGGRATVDFTPGRGKSIEDDLLERDITVNAMAWHPDSPGVVDPLGGLEDIEKRVIRLVREENLLDDPIRGLRCLRFAVQLGFSLDPATAELVRKHAKTLSAVAPERIKHELSRALAMPSGGALFPLVVDAGMDGVLFGRESKAGSIRSLEAAARAEDVLGRSESVLPGSARVLGGELESGFTRKAALRLVSFLAGDGQAGDAVFGVSSAARRLALSTRARRVMRETVEGALTAARGRPPGLDGAAWMHRLAASYGAVLPELLIVCLAWGKGPDEALARRIWEYARGPYLEQAARPLLRGSDIIEHLGVPPGPTIGELLSLLGEARAAGLVSNREEALAFLREHLGVSKNT